LQGHAATFAEQEQNGEKVGYNGNLRARSRRYLHLDYAALFLGGNDGF
jgi:hypothetical protein